MKSIFLPLFALFLTVSLQAQDFSSSHNTLLGLSVSVSDEVVNRLDRYEIETDREQDLMNRYDDTMNYRLQRLIIEPVYSLFEAKGITIAPVNALDPHVNYGPDHLPSYLFPKQAIRKAVRDGYETDYFFQIKVDVMADGLMGGLVERVKPRMTVHIRVFDTNRDEVKEILHQYVAADHIKESEFPGIRFDKLGLDYREMLLERLNPMMLEAVTEAIGQW